jgi:iron-sulfur cluster repair protein YtfE (RIC family)
MLRHKSLIPLSRQHQHALALCVRIDRASPIAAPDASAWQQEMSQHFEAEIAVHFAAEEQILFPAAQKVGELIPLTQELLSEHAWLRQRFQAAKSGQLSGPEIEDFAARLASHIRKEERQLFERMQAAMSEDQFRRIGGQLEEILNAAGPACSLPPPAPLKTER